MRKPQGAAKGEMKARKRQAETKAKKMPKRYKSGNKCGRQVSGSVGGGDTREAGGEKGWFAGDLPTG